MDANSRYVELILRAVIKCGFLRKILNTADPDALLQVLAKGSGARDIWRHVMKEAKDAGLLRDILGAAHRCGRYEEAVAAAVDGGVLVGHHEAKNVTGTIKNWPYKVSKRFISWTPFKSWNIFKALTGPKIDIVQQNVVEQAKKAGVMSDVLEGAEKHLIYGFGHNWGLPAILSAAKEAGLLMDVLRAASTCGLLGMTVAAAKEAGLLKDVLHAAIRCARLGMIEAAAKEAGLLMDVLRAATACGLLGMTMAAAKEAGLLMDVLRAASTCGLLGMTVAAAKEAGVLKDVLKAAAGCGLLEMTLAAAKEAERRVVTFNNIADSIRFFCMFNGVKTADLHNNTGKITLEKFRSGSTLDAYRMIDVCLICNVDDSAHPIQKAHFLLILAWLLQIVRTLVRGHGLSHTRNAEHRKSVISQMTICSGDIERNPGPDVILNDWLKEMYSELVRRWKGWKKKNISWKQFGLPDPRNSGQNRNTLLTLISRHGLLTLCDKHDTSDLYVDEFQLLRDNINDIKRLKLDVLDSAVKIRKILVKARELDNDVSLLPEDERRKAQRAVHGLQLQHVAFYRQGEQGAAEEQVEEEESEGDVDEDFDEDGGHDVEIREGSPPLPQPDCAHGAAVAGDEANMLLSSSIEDSNISSGNTLDALKEFLNFQFDENESIQFDESLLPGWDESTQNVPQNEARSPKRDAPSDHTPNDVMSCQHSETMEDTSEVTDNKHILQPRGPVDIQSQSQKSQSTIEPEQAPAPTPAPTPVLPTDASIHSRVDTLVQNLENVFGIRGLDSCRVNGNVRATFPLARKRSHSFDSGSNCNCRRTKMIRFT